MEQQTEASGQYSSDDRLEARILCYQALQTVFGNEPDGQRITLLAQAPLRESFELFSEFAEDAECYRAQVSDSLAAIARAADSAQLERFASEYTRLFEGPGQLPAPPWSSVYLGDPTLIFQEKTLEVRNFYRDQDLLPEGYPHIADDHLALELDFMANLALRMAEAAGESHSLQAEEALEASRSFLDGHMLAWVPQFAERLGQSGALDAYRPFARLLTAYLHATRITWQRSRNPIGTGSRKTGRGRSIRPCRCSGVNPPGDSPHAIPSAGNRGWTGLPLSSRGCGGLSRPSWCFPQRIPGPRCP